MLWMLPAAGGEAYVVAKRPGASPGSWWHGTPGRSSSRPTPLPTSADADAGEGKRKDRKDHKVSAVLHERYPVRFWDRDLGPGAPRLLVGSLDAGGKVELRDLTPDRR